MTRAPFLVASLFSCGLLVVSVPETARETPVQPAAAGVPHFRTADTCVACHTGLVTSAGETVSFGSLWRVGMMANAARDPYWHAGVRREVVDHPKAQALIEDECSACHMPMARYSARSEGHEGEVFAHLPVGVAGHPASALAADGVSCTLCHQITAERLGERSSFTGAFRIGPATPAGEGTVLGPFDVDRGRTRIMQSASGFTPAKASHVQAAAICASCHTLITQALGPAGEVLGELPEQVPYLEWEHSRYRESMSCQSCHMKPVGESMPISGVRGTPREGLSRHSFLGGNFFMARVFNRHRAELGVEALPEELDAGAARTVEHLASEAARLSVVAAAVRADRLEAELLVENLGGHKLPTAYPSRRVWIRFAVRDRRGETVFESGRVEPSGRIVGNDNDADAAAYEPHYREVTSSDQVQIYEPILGDVRGEVTTGLLTAVRYLKDNRVLPEGFDKTTASADVAVHGTALKDADFGGGSDRVRYSVAVPAGQGPFAIEAELWYQPIAHRWARNLGSVDAFETRRFVAYYDAMAAASAVVLARARVTVE